MSTPTTHTYISLAKLTRFLDKLKSGKVFVQKVETGSANGTVSVDGTDVAVKGLGAAAYTAVPTLAMGDTNGTVKFNGNSVSVKGLGSAAYTDSSAYATAAQGALAATAIQQSTLDDYISWYTYTEE